MVSNSAKFPVPDVIYKIMEVNLHDSKKIMSLENANRQLLENQSFLCEENKSLRDNMERLMSQIEDLRKAPSPPTDSKTATINLSDSLNLTKLPVKKLEQCEVENEKMEKQEILKYLHSISMTLKNINSRPQLLEIKSTKDHLSKIYATLTKRLEDEQIKSEETLEALRKLREDDEKFLLKDKICDMKQLITDLEVENTKLKLETEQLIEDVARYKKELAEANEETKAAAKEKYELEEERDWLKQKISDLENDNFRLKKDMIEELHEANRAKRVSVDTEIALQHVSEAYENKRKEAVKYQKQLEEANEIIRKFKQQLEPQY